MGGWRLQASGVICLNQGWEEEKRKEGDSQLRIEKRVTMDTINKMK